MLQGVSKKSGIIQPQNQGIKELKSRNFMFRTSVSLDVVNESSGKL